MPTPERHMTRYGSGTNRDSVMRYGSAVSQMEACLHAGSYSLWAGRTAAAAGAAVAAVSHTLNYAYVCVIVVGFRIVDIEISAVP